MIEAKNLTRKFSTEDIETHAVADVSFTIAKGEFTAIMGPSGCGKSTLLSILGLLDIPDEGSYLFNGNDVSALPESERAWLRRGTIGFVFQSFNLIDDLSVQENIVLPLTYLGVPKKERIQRCEGVMEQLGIAHRRNHVPQQLSGGQQQRVAVARALITQPVLILADEPTGNLDTRNSDDVMNLLTTLHAGGTTIVMVTHSRVQADYAERILHMADGAFTGEQFRAKAGAL